MQDHASGSSPGSCDGRASTVSQSAAFGRAVYTTTKAEFIPCGRSQAVAPAAARKRQPRPLLFFSKCLILKRHLNWCFGGLFRASVFPLKRHLFFLLKRLYFFYLFS